MWKRGAVAVAVLAVVSMCVPAQAELTMEYLGYVQQGAQYIHQYVAKRYNDPNRVEDVHIEGQYEWLPGEVTLINPVGWTGEYEGRFFHWRCADEASAWTVETTTLYGFGIAVNYITMVDTPFRFTNDREDLLGNNSVIPGGTDLVPAPIPEPASLSLLLLGGLALLKRRRVA